jgi:hypothetical protein
MTDLAEFVAAWTADAALLKTTGLTEFDVALRVGVLLACPMLAESVGPYLHVPDFDSDYESDFDSESHEDDSECLDFLMVRIFAIRMHCSLNLVFVVGSAEVVVAVQSHTTLAAAAAAAVVAGVHEQFAPHANCSVSFVFVDVLVVLSCTVPAAAAGMFAAVHVSARFGAVYVYVQSVAYWLVHSLPLHILVHFLAVRVPAYFQVAYMIVY